MTETIKKEETITKFDTLCMLEKIFPGVNIYANVEYMNGQEEFTILEKPCDKTTLVTKYMEEYNRKIKEWSDRVQEEFEFLLENDAEQFADDDKYSIANHRKWDSYWRNFSKTHPWCGKEDVGRLYETAREKGLTERDMAWEAIDNGDCDYFSNCVLDELMERGAMRQNYD